jgi:hypothetical protein
MTDMVAQAKAAVLVRKEQQQERRLDGIDAMAEYKANTLALRKRTARLRALRLSQPQPPVAAPEKRSTKK